jgi:hypothetical protein
MNTPILAVGPQTDALRDDLRPSETSPRPIPLPQTGIRIRSGARR